MISEKADEMLNTLSDLILSTMTKVPAEHDTDFRSAVVATAIGTWETCKHMHQMLMLEVNTDHGKEILLSAHMENIDEKALRYEIMRRIAVKTKATKLALVSECWLVKLNADDKTPEGSLEHVPGRTEALVITLESLNKATTLLCGSITEKNGKKVLQEFEESEPGIEGDASYLLPRKAN